MRSSSMPSTAAIVVLVRTRTASSWGARTGTGSRLGVRITLRRSAMRCWTPAATTPEGTACGAMRALDLPETEAPHPGVSSGGVEVEGAVFVRASLTGNGSPSSGRQLGRGGSGRCVCQICRKRKPFIRASARERWKWKVFCCTVRSLPPHCKLLFRGVATILRKKKLLSEKKKNMID